jgi:hypothetical protein
MIDMTKFAVIVLCHCRPNDTTTPATLRSCNYTGDIILLLDDEDETIGEYRKNFPDLTIEVYSKDEMMKWVDSMDNLGDKRCAVYARNACFDVAEKYGYKYFCQMDDDYTTIPYRYIEGDKLYRNNFSNLDEVFKAHLEFMDTNESIGSVAFAEPGDFVGGIGSNLNKKTYLHKCMGSWMCFTDRRLHFKGTMNDDVNTYSLNGHRGQLFYTFNFIMIDTPATQAVKGGMTDIYLGRGTYSKTFYTVLCCPSFVKVDMFGDRHYRIHHKFKWENAHPKLISGRYKK